MKKMAFAGGLSTLCKNVIIRSISHTTLTREIFSGIGLVVFRFLHAGFTGVLT